MTTKKNGNAGAKGQMKTQNVVESAMEEIPEIRASVLETRDREWLSRGQRLLTMIQSPAFAAGAARAGYSSEEHKEGWALLNLASGQGRSLDDGFLATRTSPTQGFDMALLVTIDELEKTWFPRMRAIVRRVVATERREELEAAFFKDLEQQPLGPMVVSSVRTFLSRLEDLEKSAEPQAKEVLAKLAARGLTAQARKQMSETGQRAEEGGEVSDAAAMRKEAPASPASPAPAGSKPIAAPSPPA